MKVQNIFVKNIFVRSHFNFDDKLVFFEGGRGV